MEKYSDVPSTIIHISDLHIKSKMFSSVGSIIQEEEHYLKQWADDLREKYPDTDFLLFITGDLTDRCAEDELQLARETIDTIINELGIDKKNVIICPGNHDFNFEKFATELYRKGVKNKHDFKNYNAIKLKDFGDFYNGFFDGSNKEKFDPEKAIFDKIIDEERKLIYLAINSLYQESQMEDDHYGYFNYHSLTKELDELDKKYKEFDKVAIMHHLPSGVAQEGNYIKDWEEKFEIVFRRHKVRTFFCGHIHTTNSKGTETIVKYNHVAVGGFGTNDNDPGCKNSFNIYHWEYTQEGSEGFKPTYYIYEQPNGSSSSWVPLTGNFALLPFITIRAKKGNRAAIDALKKPAYTTVNSNAVFNAEQDQNDADYQQVINGLGFNSTASAYITQVIKNNSLYKSGHYHWSKSGRSHSYIKTQYFFEKYNCLEKIKICYLKAIDSTIKENDIKTDLLIGYSMQGCIIGTLLAVQKGWNFTYFPEIDKIYADNERKLPDIQCTSITVLIDVVYTFNIIKRIIKVLKEKYADLEVVNIISLFYSKKTSGRENPDVDSCLKEFIQYDENIECIYHMEAGDVKIIFSYIQETCINACPFNKVEDCIIFNEKLDTVHKLFSEDVYEDN